ncbi:MAG: NADH-quinone oxidoreductase subunit NuoF [candidate division Zixibacteria bacterium]|nr:NADH-quinone oxidoreductase subunit NuoF [candidate division Zixibacteria bacterium]
MEKILFKYIDVPDQYKIDTYIRNGGYRALPKALKEYTPDELIEMVKKSGLRGRGGAGFPAGLKWSFVPKDSPKPRFLLCNADEGEPGTFKDRALIENDPHQLLEGIIIASYAIGAHNAFIYIRGEFAFGAKRLQEAIRESYQKGYLGKNILESGFDLDLDVYRGGGAYICGEETSLMESVEGGRANPRLKPPFPASVGLYKNPTVINNVETLSNVPHIVLNGGEWYANIGMPKSTGTKIFSLSGHVKRPGNYELPMGVTLRELIFEHGGGIKDDRQLKAVIPGGVSTPVLTAELLDVKMDFESLYEAGSLLGSGATIVMDESTCMVKVAYRISKFFEHESCGKCVPCREGTRWIRQIMQRIENGKGREEDIDLLRDICANIAGKTVCPLADGAVVPITSTIEKFRDEYEYHIKHKKCMVDLGERFV